ncbi:CDP-glycerol glycerophosphotransferase, TagB/SpsB family [Enterobacter sp. CC120223-11]|nr:CDP-glycerol glycerophosphotransferase, TagB/SpsB family [Enterobacter sp. CC120223-11]
MSDYIEKNNPEYELIWSVSDVVKIGTSSKIKLINSKTLKELYYYFTSSIIMTTHNEMVGAVAKNQSYISLWHGMPMKKICYLGEYDYKGMIDYPATRIATSEIMRSIISASFHEKANNVMITGQPRNDYLFEPISLGEIGISHAEGKKIVMYIPTFRQNNEDERYSDGEKIKNNNFFRVEDFDIEALDYYLDNNNIHLVLKLHPYEESSLGVKGEITNNITIIDTENLNKKNIDVNQIIPWADCLITDYSSVYFDFLLLNKPIVFLVPDLPQYRAARGGFTLEPFEYWTPGQKTMTQRDLIQALTDVFDGSDDKYSGQRKVINDLINHHQDSASCSRVMNLIEK